MASHNADIRLSVPFPPLAGHENKDPRKMLPPEGVLLQ
jgi:hypothetical protein